VTIFTIEEPHKLNGGQRDWHNGTQECCSECAVLSSFGDDLGKLERYHDRKKLVTFNSSGRVEGLSGVPVSPAPAGPGLVELESEPEGPQSVRSGRPVPGQGQDPRAQFGLLAGPPSLLPDAEGTVALFEAARDRRAVMVRTPDAVQFATITTTQSGRDTRSLGVTGRPGPRRIAELAGIQTELVSWGSSTAYPIMGAVRRRPERLRVSPNPSTRRSPPAASRRRPWPCGPTSRIRR
jgi:hypothetical protein